MLSDAKGRKVLAPAKKKITPDVLAALKEAGVTRVPLVKKDLLGAYSLAAIKGKVRTNEPLEDTQLDLLIAYADDRAVFEGNEFRVLSADLKYRIHVLVYENSSGSLGRNFILHYIGADVVRYHVSARTGCPDTRNADRAH